MSKVVEGTSLWKNKSHLTDIKYFMNAAGFIIFFVKNT